MLDPISDMLTRIRNAQMAGHAEVEMFSSKLKAAIAEVLRAEGFIDGFSISSDGPKKILRIALRYEEEKPPAPGLSPRRRSAITQIKRVSTQGQRRYVKAKDIHKVKNGYGISIISTSQGVMTGREARKRRLGGEIICEVW